MAMRTDKVIRCSSPAVSYGKVLAGLNIPEADVRKTQEILKEVPQLADLFLNPTVAQQKKNGCDRPGISGNNAQLHENGVQTPQNGSAGRDICGI